MAFFRILSGKQSRRRLAYCALTALVALSSATQSSHAQGGGPPGGYISTVVIDPLNHATLYAGTERGVFKSTDEGASWSGSSSSLTNTSVWALAINPISPAMLFAVTSSGGVFKSDNGAASWSLSKNGLADNDVFAVAIHPTNPNILYVGTSGAGVYKSADGGAVWTRSVGGLTNGQVWTLVIDPANPSTPLCRD